jgi:hypothetical protein
MLKKVLGVGAMRRCPNLVNKSSHVGVDAVRLSYLLHCPTACGCRFDALSLWFGKVLPCLVAEPSFGGVTALTDPHDMTVGLGAEPLE